MALNTLALYILKFNPWWKLVPLLKIYKINDKVTRNMAEGILFPIACAVYYLFRLVIEYIHPSLSLSDILLKIIIMNVFISSF